MAQYPGSIYNPSITGASFQDAYIAAQSDTIDLPQGPTRGIFIGGAGNLKVNMASGNAVTLVIPAGACGFTLDLCVRRVYTTGTSCTGIITLY